MWRLQRSRREDCHIEEPAGGPRQPSMSNFIVAARSKRLASIYDVVLQEPKLE
jgi:hypothetical protein